MAKMPEQIVVKVVSEKLPQCYSSVDSHRFAIPPATEGFLIAFCENCGTTLEIGWDNASGS